MSLSTLSEYQITDDIGTQTVMVADKLSTAAAQAEAVGPTVVTQVSRIRPSVQVDVPVVIPNVLFQVEVSPSAAGIAGCVALPESYTVPEGTEVILEAHIPASAGYTFTGWYRGLTLVSALAIAKIAVVAPTGPAVADVITAKFTAAS